MGLGRVSPRGQPYLILPARLASTRLSEKMLADLGGVPLVVRTWQRVASRFEHIWVATDDARIEGVVRDAGGKVVRTGAAPSGTHRVAEAARWLRAAGHLPGDGVVVNVQADEPFVDPEAVARVARAVAPAGTGGARIATGAAPLEVPLAAETARVKVVTDARGHALYFSRAAIPSGGPFRVHVGIYAFGVETLSALADLPEDGPAAALEASERLEQLRWLASGHAIRVVDLERGGDSIDTAEDLARARARFTRGG